MIALRYPPQPRSWALADYFNFLRRLGLCIRCHRVSGRSYPGTAQSQQRDRDSQPGIVSAAGCVQMWPWILHVCIMDQAAP